MRYTVTAFLIAVSILAPAASGQVATGTFNVQVQDTTGAVVPGATVTLTHVGTGLARQGQTNEEGMYRATFLPIGGYTLSAEAGGFKKRVITGLDLRVDQNTTITAVLETGEVREVVEVTGV